MRPLPRSEGSVYIARVSEHIRRVLRVTQGLRRAFVECAALLLTGKLRTFSRGECGEKDDEHSLRVHDLLSNAQFSERIIEQGLKQITCLLCQGVLGCVLDNYNGVLARCHLLGRVSV